EERVRLMLEDSGAEVVLTQEPFWEKAALCGAQAVLLSESADMSGEALDIGGSADDLAYVIYTSGSTGRPKGTMLSHRGVVNLAQWKRDEYGYGEEDTVLQFASHSFDASVAEIYPALLSGAHLHVLAGEQRQSVDAYCEAVAASRVRAVLWGLLNCDSSGSPAPFAATSVQSPGSHCRGSPEAAGLQAQSCGPAVVLRAANSRPL
ncbi:MAG: AMP-binding protein, partial [Myxococcales bacterium]